MNDPYPNPNLHSHLTHGQPPTYPQHYQQSSYPQPAWQPSPPRRNKRSRTTAALLALFLGWFGAHKFYLGRVDHGIVYFIFAVTGIPFLISLVDFILCLTKSDEQFDREYDS